MSLPDAEERRVGAAVAVDEVVAAAAEEGLVAAAAEEDVVAAPAVDDRRPGGRERAVGGVEQDEVVAAARVDDDGREAVDVERCRRPTVGIDVDLELRSGRSH